MFRHHNQILNLMDCGETLNQESLDRLLEKSLSGKNLELAEVLQLLLVRDEYSLTKIYKTAQAVKEKIYGQRVVLFAPLYLTNKCVNNCLYCGFNSNNFNIDRKELGVEEAIAQAKLLTNSGQKRLLLVAGEENSPKQIDKIAKIMQGIYKQTDIRRINLNIAPLDEEGYKKIKEPGLGTYQLFQETYHYESYKKMHPSGPKSDFEWRYEGPFRALKAGIDDIGMGVLFGLYDYRYEILSLLAHIKEMEEKYGVGPHTISVPRLKPALGAELKEVPYPISDDEFKKVVAILRLAVPYTGLILSTRESVSLRQELLSLGISQISAGSCTSPGGYGSETSSGGQFEVDDLRTLNEIIDDLLDRGFIPSFCTACYRKERTGASFISLAKQGLIRNRCQVNALLTLKEYSLQYPNVNLNDKLQHLLRQQLENLEPQDRELVNWAFIEMEKGASDLFC